MSVKTIVQTAKEFLLNGQTAEALDKLIAFLESDEKYEQLLRLSITARSEYSRLESEQRQGFISQDEANARLNRLNNRLLDILDRLADGRLEVEDLPVQTPAKSKRKKMLLIGIPLLLFIGAYLGYRFWPSPNPPEKPISCPDFSNKANLKVLLLPFKSISGQTLQAEYTVKQRLDDLAYEKDLPVDVQIFEGFYDRPDAKFPGFRQATKIGNRCQADLILWGTAEKTPDNRIVLTSKFKFLGSSETFQVKKIELEGETDLVAVSSISSLLQEGSFTEDVETLILAFYGLLAHQEGQYAEAAKAFEAVSEKGNMPEEIVHTILADSYLAMNQPDKAIRHYEAITRLKPNDTIALNNLAWLQISLEKPLEAVKAAEQILQIDPDNKGALLTRAYAYLEAKEYEQAAKDFERIENDKRIRPKSPDNDLTIERPKRIDPQKLRTKPLLKKDKIIIEDKKVLQRKD